VNLFLALVVAVLFGTGASMLLKPDLFRVVVGLALVANAASLTVIAAALSRGQAPISPLIEGESVDLDDLARSERSAEEELERGVPIEHDVDHDDAEAAR